MSKPANQISFDYNGKHYVLEYTRASIRRMEASGFNPNEVADKPAISLEQMWEGAFYEHHKNIGHNLVMSLLELMKDKALLFEKLREMLAETYESLLPEGEDSGNVEWTATM